MLTISIGLGIGVLLGSTAPIIFRRLQRCSPKLRSAADERRYGHPLPPVSTLRKSLPSPPHSHAWEISVQHVEDGTPFLHLDVVELISGRTVASTRKDLVNGEYWSWARAYRLYTTDRWHARTKFRGEFIGPLTDWAVGQVNRLDRSNALGEYTISGDRNEPRG